MNSLFTGIEGFYKLDIDLRDGWKGISPGDLINNGGPGSFLSLLLVNSLTYILFKISLHH